MCTSTLDSPLSPPGRAQQETLKSQRSERESLGVELYGVQQQLARQQMLLEGELDQHAGVSELRRQGEEALTGVRAAYRDLREQLKGEQQQSQCGGQWWACI